MFDWVLNTPLEVAVQVLFYRKDGSEKYMRWSYFIEVASFKRLILVPKRCKMIFSLLFLSSVQRIFFAVHFKMD